MKKIISLVLVIIVLLIGLVACTDGQAINNSNNKPTIDNRHDVSKLGEYSM